MWSLLFILSIAQLAEATNSEGLKLSPNAYACLQQVNRRAMLRKYNVRYQYPFCFRTSSSQENFSKASSASSFENSTRSIDPGITTGELESSTEFSSSKGKCGKYLSEHQSWWKRQIYVVDNFPELRSDLARGDGEYLDALQYLSLCHGVSSREFSRVLKSQYGALYQDDDPLEFSLRVDRLIRATPVLAAGCTQISA